ncbi:hypothetical protein JEG43_05890 [Anoxybacillus sp. LAT_35]|uniref:YncE family protein n=1 Tax=unclassified Anoxybacillus TaxID=2639704 RepID=UPI001EDC67AB|nr:MULTISPECIES: hypothetical protein [unclassified Anoxybacillus]MCG6196473.1 hypothetical protein [Anoxybacillus sp. LAT_38]MCG6170477.1 hypothetical protein [Anoxybacillus sp. LAT_11]MCG6175426.1 hypothetical protein [Anoxybacillus sp. LAT_31]MCG6177590.1 hypothetical protein [Anoxybacillus sp. LAT_35]MCG6181918.1 hypothetical protein [Anoxybacillus sp. LAT_33]
MQVRFFFLLIIVVLLGSCTPETYTPIPRNKSVVGVVNIKEQSLSFVDYNTKKTMATWKMKNPVTKAILLPDGDTVMLFGQDMDEMMMYTLSTGKEKKRWRVNKGVTDVLVTKHELLVVNEKDGTVSFMTFDGKVKETIATPSSPFSIVADDKHRQWIVIHFKHGAISFIDQQTKRVKRTVDTLDFAVSGLVVAETDELWVGGHGSGAYIQQEAYVHSLVDGRLLARVKAETMPIQFSQTSEAVYVLCHGSNMLYAFEPKTKHVIRSLNVGANPFAMIKTKSELIIASYDSNELVFVDEKTFKQTKTVSVGQGPFYIFFRDAKEE